MSALSIVLLVVGIMALVVGAEWLVRGSARLAARTGLSTVVIGLTVVAFGTSAPELAVSVGDVIRGGDEAGAIALGNVVGSNIANVLLALGLAAAIGGALVVAPRIIRIDVPIMIGVSVLVLFMALDERIGRVEGLILVGALVVYLAWTVIAAKRGDLPAGTDELGDVLAPEQQRSVWSDLGFVAAGLVMLVVGSQALVKAASDMAADLGVSDLVIGLTVVAIGTSLPEVATSVLAAMRGERDLAVGNAIGSNLFNLLAVLGITGAVAPDAIPVPQGAIQVDFPVMIVVAVACLPIFTNGHVLRRWEGAVFFAFYAAYLTWLVLDAADHSVRDDYGAAMLFFVVPLTAITLTVVGYRSRPSARI
ncbi:MAG: calcium/sodium antiporter [Ilumatobacter sp.]|nr:calcium/sodium antiporter [Ilumatobacter sp.]